jgi:hypothetical protein
MILFFPFRFILFPVFLMAVFSSAPAAVEDPFQLVQRAVARDRILLERRAIYDCSAASRREKLDREGKVTSTDTDSITLKASKSPDYGTRKALDQVKGMENDLEKASKEEPFNILKIIDHFNYAWAGEETVNGVPCHKIRFAPKGKQPFRNREEKVANELAGYFWVSKSDDTLMKNRGSLTRPVSVAWFFATLRELDFSFETRQLPNGDFGPAKIQYRFKVNVPFGQIHERHTRSLTNYRKAKAGY